MLSTRYVKIDGRTFAVARDEQGKPVRIRERKVYAPGEPWESLCEKSYWSAKHHKLPVHETSIVARILAAG